MQKESKVERCIAAGDVLHLHRDGCVEEERLSTADQTRAARVVLCGSRLRSPVA